MPPTRRTHLEMRFQVHPPGNTPPFSESALAPLDRFVTVSEAVVALKNAHANVDPKRLRNDAKAAVDAQIAWLRARPPSGVSSVGNLKSKPFATRGGIGRVDIENLYGHNLRS